MTSLNQNFFLFFLYSHLILFISCNPIEYVSSGPILSESNLDFLILYLKFKIINRLSLHKAIIKTRWLCKEYR
jgi:hypothetical protein